MAILERELINTPEFEDPKAVAEEAKFLEELADKSALEVHDNNREHILTETAFLLRSKENPFAKSDSKTFGPLIEDTQEQRQKFWEGIVGILNSNVTLSEDFQELYGLQFNQGEQIAFSLARARAAIYLRAGEIDIELGTPAVDKINRVSLQALRAMHDLEEEAQGLAPQRAVV